MTYKTGVVKYINPNAYVPPAKVGGATEHAGRNEAASGCAIKRRIL